MTNLVNLCAFALDGAFIVFFFGASGHWTTSRLRQIGALGFLLLTSLLYMPGSALYLASTVWHRLVARIFLYAAYFLAAYGVPMPMAVHGSLVATAAYLVVQNSFLTPTASLILRAQLSIVDSPFLNQVLCAAVVCGIKAICCLCLYKLAPLRNVHHIGVARVTAPLIIIVVSISLKELQKPLADSAASVPELSLYFLILQAVLFLCLILFEQFQHKLEENTAYRIQSVSSQALIEHLQLRQEQDQAMRTLRHDLKNHLLSLRHLIQSGSAQEAVSYINSILGQAGQDELRFQTGSSLLDYLISEKLGPAARQGVAVSVVMDLRQGKFMDDFDLCTIMGNALDNAVEACLRMPETAARFIDIRGGTTAGRLLIHIANSSLPVERPADGLPRTSKENRGQHGFGLTNIRHVLRKYHGDLFLDPGEDRFTFTLSIPIPAGQ